MKILQSYEYDYNSIAKALILENGSIFLYENNVKSFKNFKKIDYLNQLSKSFDDYNSNDNLNKNRFDSGESP